MLGSMQLATLCWCTLARPADIGGWMGQRAQPPQPAIDGPACERALAQSREATSGEDFYHLALCQLNRAPADPGSARAWLDRAVAKDHLPAYRLLHLLGATEPASVAATRHCHDLGAGQRLCHGGPGAIAVVESHSTGN
jgi:hypothetical protein